MQTTLVRRTSAALVVVAGLAVVHYLSPVLETSAQQSGTKPASPASAPSPSAQTSEKTPKGQVYTGTLPPNVIDMREMILAAVHSGRIEDLQAAIDQNELPPEGGAPQGTGLIEHLRKTSADGAGREMLAILDNLLKSEPTLLPIGRDAENNGVYVWPAVAEADLEKLTPAQEVSLYRLMPVAQAKAMIAAKKWSWWRLAIGADGTWLTFLKHE
jgi:hypothetical protein